MKLSTSHEVSALAHADSKAVGIVDNSSVAYRRVTILRRVLAAPRILLGCGEDVTCGESAR